MKIAIDLKGRQTSSHCSLGSSICACEKLNLSSGKCKLFKTRLQYDFEAHAYERCTECLENGIKEV